MKYSIEWRKGFLPPVEFVGQVSTDDPAEAIAIAQSKCKKFAVTISRGEKTIWASTGNFIAARFLTVSRVSRP